MQKKWFKNVFYFTEIKNTYGKPTHIILLLYKKINQDLIIIYLCAVKKQE